MAGARAGRWTAAVAVCGWASLAAAQLPAPASGSASASASAAASPAGTNCLTHLAGIAQPEYPDEAFKRKDAGTIHVTLTFNGPQSSPRVSFTDPAAAFESLRRAVYEHVDGLRLPCHAGTGPVVLRQSYVFIPNDGRKVVSTRARTAEDAELDRQRACVVHVDGETRPAYATRARRAEEQAVVYVKLTFSAPDQPPERLVLAETGMSVLKAAVEAFDRKLRMPCLEGPPVSVDRLYKFKLDGGSRTVLKDPVSLVNLLGAVKNLPRNVYFDLNQMGCPFDVRLRYLQPHRPNGVGELDATRPERQPFLDWLSQLQLNLSESTNTQVLGDSFTVQVPCTIVDL